MEQPPDDAIELDEFEAGWLAAFFWIKGYGSPPSYEEFKEAVEPMPPGAALKKAKRRYHQHHRCNEHQYRRSH